MKIRIVLIGACVAAALASNLVVAQEKAKPAAPPKVSTKDERGRNVLVENERVRVSEVSYKVGASSGMEARRDRVVRALTDGTLEKTFADGRKETITWKAGQVRYLTKETYSQKNIGKTDLVLYSVTLK